MIVKHYFEYDTAYFSYDDWFFYSCEFVLILLRKKHIIDYFVVLIGERKMYVNLIITFVSLKTYSLSMGENRVNLFNSEQ